MTSAMDDALKRVTAAVERYEAPEPMIRVTSGSLAGRSKEQRLCMESAALGDAILNVAELHDGPHGRCPTCSGIRDALAVAMGVLRAEVDVEFSEMLGE